MCESVCLKCDKSICECYSLKLGKILHGDCHCILTTIHRLEFYQVKSGDTIVGRLAICPTFNEWVLEIFADNISETHPIPFVVTRGFTNKIWKCLDNQLTIDKLMGE